MRLCKIAWNRLLPDGLSIAGPVAGHQVGRVPPQHVLQTSSVYTAKLQVLNTKLREGPRATCILQGLGFLASCSM